MLLTCVPMEKSFPAEHCRELLRDSLEDLLEEVAVIIHYYNYYKDLLEQVDVGKKDVVNLTDMRPV